MKISYLTLFLDPISTANVKGDLFHNKPVIFNKEIEPKADSEACTACVFPFMLWSLVLTHKNERMQSSLVCGHSNPPNQVCDH